jgi:hypothetical protein
MKFWVGKELQGKVNMGNINTHANSDGTSHSNVKQHNFTATTVPDVTNDDTEGYSIGSMWWYADARKMFMCFDDTTDSAVWKLVNSNGLVVNNTGGTLSQLYVVQPDTPVGIFPGVKLAKADTEADSMATLGVILEDIANNEKGYIINGANIYRCDGSGTTFGESWSDGDTLWLSAATAGYMTKTKPSSPNHAVVVGRVLDNHATLGVIAIEIANGWETYELHDVDDTAPTTDADLLAWDDTASIYKPTQIVSTSDHLTVGYTAGGPTIDLTPVHSISYAPTGVEFGNTTQSYDVDGTTWVSAVAGGTLGGIPDEASSGHELSACLAAITTARDGSYLAVREASGAASATNPNTVHFLFTNVDAFDTIDMLMQYTGGAAHVMAIELYDYVNTAYVRIKEFSDDSFFVDYSIKIHGSSNFVGTGGNDGDVILQIIHDNAGNTAHNIQVEYVKLVEGW